MYECMNNLTNECTNERVNKLRDDLPKTGDILALPPAIKGRGVMREAVRVLFLGARYLSQGCIPPAWGGACLVDTPLGQQGEKCFFVYAAIISFCCSCCGMLVLDSY